MVDRKRSLSVKSDDDDENDDVPLHKKFKVDTKDEDTEGDGENKTDNKNYNDESNGNHATENGDKDNENKTETGNGNGNGDNAIENDNEEEDEEEEDEEDDDEAEEERKRITNFNFDGEIYTFKERPSVIEEKEGKIEFRVVNNDNSRENLIVLTGLKNIFQKQLPKMPREYISRLVYDRSHLSMAVVRKPLTVVGGITYRPFNNRGFAEIVFCAISSTEQVRGYGAHLMNHLKDYVRATSPIKYF